MPRKKSPRNVSESNSKMTDLVGFVRSARDSASSGGWFGEIQSFRSSDARPFSEQFRCLLQRFPPLDIVLPMGHHRGMISPPSRRKTTANSPNERPLADIAAEVASPWTRIIHHEIAGATVLDCGIDTRGSIELGLLMAKVCAGGLLTPSVVPIRSDQLGVPNAIHVVTDQPLMACLGCQYAGWPVKTDDFFAMGSGPIRLLRGREEVLKEFDLRDPDTDHATIVLESDSLPTDSAISLIAEQSGRDPDQLSILVAPSTCIAGSTQVVARSVETAMHKLHAIGFDVRKVVSATGVAPLPPPAKPGKSIVGIGRTNDAMLYGAEVTFWVDGEDDAIAEMIDQIPSQSSASHGKPFADIFADHDHDFYAIDPGLFSPAVVCIHNLASGNSFQSGQVLTSVLRQSFGT